MMHTNDDQPRTNHDEQPLHPVWGRVALLVFGLSILAFLTAIDRPEWFHLKPATGTAAAMVYASDHNP
jgi:hypothetical protein